jgi:hypothetical protein
MLARLRDWIARARWPRRPIPDAWTLTVLRPSVPPRPAARFRHFNYVAIAPRAAEFPVPPDPYPLQEKIEDERLWIQTMHISAMQRAAIEAYRRSTALMHDLCGVPSAPPQQLDRLRIESRKLPGRVYHVSCEGDMVYVEEPNSTGRWSFTLCAGPLHCPGPDIAIAQALFLIAAEDSFLAVAVPRRPERCWPARVAQ